MCVWRAVPRPGLASKLRFHASSGSSSSLSFASVHCHGSRTGGAGRTGGRGSSILGQREHSPLRAHALSLFAGRASPRCVCTPSFLFLYVYAVAHAPDASQDNKNGGVMPRRTRGTNKKSVGKKSSSPPTGCAANTKRVKRVGARPILFRSSALPKASASVFTPLPLSLRPQNAPQEAPSPLPAGGSRRRRRSRPCPRGAPSTSMPGLAGRQGRQKVETCRPARPPAPPQTPSCACEGRLVRADGHRGGM